MLWILAALAGATGAATGLVVAQPWLLDPSIPRTRGLDEAVMADLVAVLERGLSRIRHASSLTGARSARGRLLVALDDAGRALPVGAASALHARYAPAADAALIARCFAEADTAERRLDGWGAVQALEAVMELVPLESETWVIARKRIADLHVRGLGR